MCPCPPSSPKARGHGAYLFVALDPKTVGEREYGLLAKETGDEI